MSGARGEDRGRGAALAACPENLEHRTFNVQPLNPESLSSSLLTSPRLCGIVCGMPNKPVYQCTGCGTCCRWPGYVRVSEEEVDAIAEHLDMSVDQFVKDFTCITADRKSLTLLENPDGSCMFLSADNRCWINDVKPQQCRDFPNKWNFPGFDRFCRALKMDTTDACEEPPANTEH